MSGAKKDRELSMLEEAEQARENALRPSFVRRVVYFVVALLTILTVLRK